MTPYVKILARCVRGHWTPLIFNEPRNDFARIATAHCRDFFPARGGSQNTKFGPMGPNFWSLMGKSKFRPPIAPPLTVFLDQSLHFLRGTEKPYLSSKCGHPGGLTSDPRIFQPKNFSTRGLHRTKNPEIAKPQPPRFSAIRVRSDQHACVWRCSGTRRQGLHTRH